MVRRAVHRIVGVGPRVRWNGKGGARLPDLIQLLADLASSGPPPRAIVVHLGTNDRGFANAFSLRQGIRIFMSECLANYPTARVVWSDILLRACYFGALSPAKVEMKRRSTNKWSLSLGHHLGVGILHHPQFRWSFFHLFLVDGVHLSREGLALFRQNLATCIRFYCG